jgi:hypothetical protein
MHPNETKFSGLCIALFQNPQSRTTTFFHECNQNKATTIYFDNIGAQPKLISKGILIIIEYV